MEPCGTPEDIGREFDVAPSTVTRWRRPVKYEVNYVSKLPPQPQFFSLLISFL